MSTPLNRKEAGPAIPSSEPGQASKKPKLGMPKGLSSVESSLQSMKPEEPLKHKAPAQRREELPKVSEENRKKLLGFIKTIHGIHTSSGLMKFWNAATSALPAINDFKQISREIHFLSSLAVLRKDEEHWELATALFKSDSGSNKGIEYIAEYHAHWSDRIAKEEIRVFCNQTGICSETAERYLREGSHASLSSLLKLMIASSEKSFA